MMSYSGQLDKHLMHGMKNSASSDTPVMNVALSLGQVKDSNYAARPAHDHKHRKALDIVGNAGEGEAWMLGDVLSWSLTRERNRGQLV